MSKTTFSYRPLTNKQLAKMVYKLNKEVVRVRDLLHESYRCGFDGDEELAEKAQKMINRARLEGIL